MFTEAAAEIDEVLWLLGYYSQWMPFMGSIITGKIASFHYSVLKVSRIFLTEVKTKIKTTMSTIALCLKDNIFLFLNSKCEL